MSIFVTRDPVPTLTIARPERANAYTANMLDALATAIDQLGDASVVVVQSEGNGAFCGGADLQELAGHRAEDALSHRAQSTFDQLASAPFVSIAAIHGAAIAGGFELALTADIVIAEKSARFSFPELRLGIIPGFGGIPRLERELGNGVARDLLLTGRSMGARRASELGLVAQVVSRGKGVDAARKVAQQACPVDPSTVAQAKRFLKRVPSSRLAAERALFLDMVTDDRVSDALSDFVSRTDVRPYLP